MPPAPNEVSSAPAAVSRSSTTSSPVASVVIQPVTTMRPMESIAIADALDRLPPSAGAMKPSGAANEGSTVLSLSSTRATKSWPSFDPATSMSVLSGTGTPVATSSSLPSRSTMFDAVVSGD